MVQGDPLVGRQLANYLIEREIGRGGMAVVYFGRDVRLNRPAAIKVIDARFRDQPHYTGRFLQEARLIASWRHEHILQVYYADEVSLPGTGSLFFFAMEYIDGQNLAEEMASRVKQHGHIPPAEVLKYGWAVAQALDYAHRNGVVHRDVKPANVLVSKDGRIVLSDFGLALDVQQGSIGEVFGSAHYIAPEQARRSADAVPQSDLYSLGVILYEMLTGVVPFDDPSPTSVALQHITLPPPRPRDINPELSAEVEAVLLKALSKKPADRYASGKELMGALENALAGAYSAQPVPPTFPPVSRPVPVLSLLKGKIVLAAGIALLVLALSVSVWVWASRSETASRSSSTPSAVALLSDNPTTALALLPTFTALASEPTLTTQLNSPATPSAGSVTDTPPLPASTQPVQATAQFTPTWTPKYASGRRMLLSWNDSSFYMLQLTGYGELIDPLAFERLSPEGVPSNRFSGKAWAEYHSATLRDWCMRLEIGGPRQPADLEPYLRPAACENHDLATRWPAVGDASIFWTRQEGSRQFRVLWGRDEIQRCEIDAGTCEVYLP